MGDEDRELVVSAQQLCQYLAAAETMVRQRESLSKHTFASGSKKRKRSETPQRPLGAIHHIKPVTLDRVVIKKVKSNINPDRILLVYFFLVDGQKRICILPDTDYVYHAATIL